MMRICSVVSVPAVSLGTAAGARGAFALGAALPCCFAAPVTDGSPVPTPAFEVVLGPPKPLLSNNGPELMTDCAAPGAVLPGLDGVTLLGVNARCSRFA